MFYPKLALTNLKKNGKTYLPYLLAAVICVMMFYVMNTIAGTEGLEHSWGARDLKFALSWAAGLTGIFTSVFLFYTNSFLVRQRKKEFGLYQVLGMDKRNLTKMMVWEALLTAFTSLTAGIVLGELLGRLMFLVLLKLMHIPPTLKFHTTFLSLKATVLLFLAVFGATLLFNIFKVQISNPIGLLHGEYFGEREPKAKRLLALLGVIALAAGYMIAQTTKSPMNALGEFFIAVILVIAGTYLLFTAGSIAILKLLRKNKKFYYKSKHFISVSGMIYRMKQNAVGLANICIMSTVVLVLISVTFCMYAGIGDVLKTRYPTDISVRLQDVSKANPGAEDRIVKEEAKAHDLQIKKRSTYKSGSFTAVYDKTAQSIVPSGQAGQPQGKTMVMTTVIPLSDYSRLTGTAEVLDSKQILVIKGRVEVNGKAAPPVHAIQFGNDTFQEKKEVKAGSQLKTIADNSGVIIVMPDEAVGRLLAQVSPIRYYDAFDMEGRQADKDAAAAAIQKRINREFEGAFMQYRDWEKGSVYSLYGGFLFLGVFVGTLFLMATVLIIYYKQISEGYEDRSRYQIMQQVGMSRKEVQGTIKSQVLMVFFLPLIAAVIHLTFAFKVIKYLLATGYMTNVPLFILCTIGTVLCFALFYGIVFGITSREYYKIVK